MDHFFSSSLDFFDSPVSEFSLVRSSGCSFLLCTSDLIFLAENRLWTISSCCFLRFSSLNLRILLFETLTVKANWYWYKIKIEINFKIFQQTHSSQLKLEEKRSFSNQCFWSNFLNGYNYFLFQPL